jgi:ribonucleoside-diphosphate reductase alpha chain
MGIKYGSSESIPVIEKIYQTIRDNAYETSALLSKEKGPFGEFDKEKYLQGVFIRKLPGKIKKLIAKNGIRNAIILTQAPTGTVSLLAGVSSGIEPVYEFTYRRNDRTGEHVVNHPLYQKWVDKHPNEVTPDYFVTANQLTPEDHVRVQATIQNLTDSSISKTVNAPNSHSVDDVKKLYRLAYELGCKGITYFRDGSRVGVLSKVGENQKDTPKQITLERPLRVDGATYRIPTPLGVSFITVNQDSAGNPFEVFITIGKAGSEVAAMAEALGRMISTTLRFGNHLPAMERAREIVDQLRNIGGGRSVGFGPNKIRSLPDAVAKALSLHFGFNGENHAELSLNKTAEPNGETNLQAGTGAVAYSVASQNVAATTSSMTVPVEILNKAGDICPSCGASALVYEEGCTKCHACGHSEC